MYERIYERTILGVGELKGGIVGLVFVPVSAHKWRMKRLNTDQTSFKRFARTLKEKYSRVVVWAGAGVSKPGNCPTWPELLAAVSKQAEIKAESLDPLGQQLAKELILKCERVASYWEKFSLLKKALGESTYPMVVREAFAKQAKIPPRFYTEMWRMGVQGFITTNLDRFSVRAATIAEIRDEIVELDARDSADHGYLLRTQQKFVVNVHGRLEAESSWVLTGEELSNLRRLPEYWALIESWLRNCAVLFVGCSPDDVSVAVHLEKLKETKLKLEGHFWLTHRNDQTADEWAERHGLSRIFFDAKDGEYDGVDEFLTELRRYNSHDEPPPIVVPPSVVNRSETLPTPIELLLEPSVNRLRAILNSEANRILTSGKSDKERKREYEEFSSQYEEALHRAWFVSTNKGAEFFDLQIYQTLKKGAFGQVYDAIDPVGNHVALKVLHGNVKDDPAMLTCFRRGVEAMRLLTEYKIDGVVPYLRAWEIPTCAVMELIDGVNLQEAVERGQADSWHEILKISYSLASIIKSAHSTPAGVLHRDLRPANIMLDGKENRPGRKVLVLDFDLCWHQDAGDGASLRLDAEANNGYLAPEQLNEARHHLTRKPLVDSFGIGMVCYFLVARKHPEINQYMFKDWEEKLINLARNRTCREWNSAPMRFVRIILNATRDEQSARWDVTKIVSELGLLYELVCNRRNIATAELLAEELLSRSSVSIGPYEWSIERSFGRFQPREGFDITLRWSERERRVLLEIQWLQTGSYRFDSLKKYMNEAVALVEKALRAAQWDGVRHRFGTGGLTFESFISLHIVHEDSAVSRAATGLSQAVDALRMLGVKSQ